MRKKLFLLVVLVAILGAMVTMAGCPPPPPPEPPPCGGWDCSPGYWKNHPEDWCNSAECKARAAAWRCGENLTLMEALRQKGNEDKDCKWAAHAWLNANADGNVHCDD